MSFWQIWNMSFGFMGIQFGWGLQLANMSGIYTYLGAKPEHFWRSFAESLQCNLHIDLIRGRNTHHILEATFKGAARALRQAVERDPRIAGVLSTKGTL
jgi:imidazoleglycerol phosphate dehydratase HisB